MTSNDRGTTPPVIRPRLHAAHPSTFRTSRQRAVRWHSASWSSVSGHSSSPWARLPRSSELERRFLAATSWDDQWALVRRLLSENEGSCSPNGRS